jgi:NAD-dependent dihydropyrimidine dehydrogenase PreA subunit
MCEFCTQHGEGSKWYLNMKNYSRDLLEQDDRREYMIEFLNTFETSTPASIATVDKLSRSPLSSLSRWYLTRTQKKSHFGQVLPIEDVEQILKRIAGVIRLPCVCRKVTTGNKNARYCYGLTLDQRLRDSLDDSSSLEILTTDQAIDSIRTLDNEGLVHSIWTFKTPYIGGLCNCDQDCMAYRVTYERKYYQNMFRGEYVANIDWQACNGCKACLRQCQFGALRFTSVNKKVLVDPRACFGCGVCRSSCHHDAIYLLSREALPIAANIW